MRLRGLSDFMKTCEASEKSKSFVGHSHGKEIKGAILRIKSTAFSARETLLVSAVTFIVAKTPCSFRRYELHARGFDGGVNPDVKAFRP